jgi:hypothetical protein
MEPGASGRRVARRQSAHGIHGIGRLVLLAKGRP